MGNQKTNSFSEAAAVLSSISEQIRTAEDTHQKLDGFRHQIGKHVVEIQQINADLSAAGDELKKETQNTLVEIQSRLVKWTEQFEKRHNKQDAAFQKLQEDSFTELNDQVKNLLNESRAQFVERIDTLSQRLDDRYAEQRGLHEAFQSTLDARLSQELGNLSRSIEEVKNKTIDAQKQVQNDLVVRLELFSNECRVVY